MQQNTENKIKDWQLTKLLAFICKFYCCGFLILHLGFRLRVA